MSSSQFNYEVTVYQQYDLKEPLIFIPFITMILGCILNLGVVFYACMGWLINPRITKLVILGSSLEVSWLIIFCVQSFYVVNRPVMIVLIYLGYAAFLVTGIQHIELLKLFICLSDYWTDEKCRTYQRVWVTLYLIFITPCLIWPLGLEKNSIATIINFCGSFSAVGMLIISDNFCAFVAIKLMWKHLQEFKSRGRGPPLPIERYTKTMVWIAFHASLDIFALVTYIIARFTPTTTQADINLNFFWNRFSSTIGAYHPALFPVVFCAIRNLKFQKELSENSSSKNGWTAVKNAVRKITSLKSSSAKSSIIKSENSKAKGTSKEKQKNSSSKQLSIELP